MAAPNIVNVASITGVTTFKAGIGTETQIFTLVNNPSSSGKVIKVNSVVCGHWPPMAGNYAIRYMTIVMASGCVLLGLSPCGNAQVPPVARCF